MDISNLFGKFNEMQENLQEAQKKLSSVYVHADAGGGMVKVTANANKQILKLEIDPDVRNDPEMMEDLICAAVNKALDKAEIAHRDEMAKVTKNMLPNIPGLDLSKLGL
jgi:DNA-binding YbaB/EbfC family protein